jgi:hypothetical protein
MRVSVPKAGLEPARPKALVSKTSVTTIPPLRHLLYPIEESNLFSLLVKQEHFHYTNRAKIKVITLTESIRF